MTVLEQLTAARAAAPTLAALGDVAKRDALLAMADEVENSTPAILAANEVDLAAARDTLRPAMIDRLTLTPARIASLAEGMRQVAALPDPVGEVRSRITRPSGLCIERVAVPLGVVAIIYESRPNVTGDAAALAFRSGNACVLRSGKEAHASCAAIVDALHRALAARGLPTALISLVEDTSRASATALMTAVGLVDLLIPRGGAGLIRACVEQARVPCIQTGTGICHIYVDTAADLEKAVRVVVNAKTSRPSVCNAAEVCLVHEDVAPAFLPRLKEALVDARLAAGEVPVELRTDAVAHALIGGTPATEDDFDTEFLDYILAVGVVPDVRAAVTHIAAHSTGHSEAILSEDPAAQDYFVSHVDSAAVYVNASTRFTDGGEFGLGCEMGISTQKLHARGPMGLCELTTYKYVIRGEGQIR